MKKIIPLIIALVLISYGSLMAQTRSLKQVMELQMPKTAEDELCGTRGASVCWHPITKKYYAVFCGNSGFPLAVFTPAGKRISVDDLTAMEDLRGMWYNAEAKILVANGYSDIGWLSYDLDNAGIPAKINYLFADMHQPEAQSVGSYDARSKNVFFLDRSRVMMYNIFGRIADSAQIHWGRKKSQGPGADEDELDENENYNFTNVVATGIKDAEFGLLNTTEKQIELYDAKEGYLKQTLKLPEGAPVEASFNFAFSNGIYWLFDITNRKWIGYK